LYLFATLKNVEVRREFIRKVGVEQLCQNIGSEMIDKDGNYELHLIDLGGTTGLLSTSLSAFLKV
jgi:hypothetical protein